MRNSRIRGLHGVGIDPKAQIVDDIKDDAAQAVARLTCDDLPVSARFALLYMRRNAGPVTAKVVDAMRAMGVRFTASDFDQLRAFGLVEKPQGSHHIPTDAGMREIARLTDKLAVAYEIHSITYHKALPRSNMGAFAHCSCSHWQLTVGRSWSDFRRLERSGGRHLEQAANGTWRKPRSLEEMFPELFGTDASKLPPSPNAAAPETGAVMSPSVAAPGYSTAHDG